MKPASSILALIAAVVLLWPRADVQPVDDVARAFDSYESMWREVARQTANALEGGDLTSDVEVQSHLSERLQHARKEAFEVIARKEQDQLGDGEWTAEKHAAILRSYVR